MVLRGRRLIHPRIIHLWNTLHILLLWVIRWRLRYQMVRVHRSMLLNIGVLRRKLLLVLMLINILNLGRSLLFRLLVDQRLTLSLHILGLLNIVELRRQELISYVTGLLLLLFNDLEFSQIPPFELKLSQLFLFLGVLIARFFIFDQLLCGD